MNCRPLDAVESANLAALNEAGLENVLLFLTATGLRKSILDATDPMRSLFRAVGFHDYAQQPQGQLHKVIRRGVLIDAEGNHPVDISLYRPQTKSGDPRFWIGQLRGKAAPDEVCAIFFVKRVLHAVNITRTAISGAAPESAIAKLLTPLQRTSDSTAEELLALLRAISARGPLRATCIGDTAIGRTIEDALAIAMNSRRTPDFRGIELKTGRSQLHRDAIRATLFACVPNWHLSACKSSAEILRRFGYERGSCSKLYCTVSTQRVNAQGLRLRVDEAARWLCEVATRMPGHNVAVWRLNHLENRLSEKHRETFWIEARPERRPDGEWFHLQSVTHTRNPNLPQLERLLGDGSVTVDHLIKKSVASRVVEKGPLFKIARSRIPELFLGAPREHSLTPG